MALEKIVEDNKCTGCTHDVCYEVGFQVGFEEIKGFYIGNCVLCETTKNISDYHPIERVEYNGKKVYVR